MPEPEQGWRSLGLQAFQAFFEHAMDGILFTIPDGRILAANPAACELLGRSESEICALGRQGLTDANDPRWEPAVAGRAFAGRMRAELRMLRGDGSVFEADVASAIFTTATGEPRALVIFRDLSEQLAATQELALLEQREKMSREVHELVLTGVSAALVDLDGLLGRTRDEQLRQRLSRVAATLEETLVGVRQAVSQARPTG